MVAIASAVNTFPNRNESSVPMFLVIRYEDGRVFTIPVVDVDSARCYALSLVYSNPNVVSAEISPTAPSNSVMVPGSPPEKKGSIATRADYGTVNLVRMSAGVPTRFVG